MATATRVYMHTVPVRTTGSLDYWGSRTEYIARIWKDARPKRRSLCMLSYKQTPMGCPATPMPTTCRLPDETSLCRCEYRWSNGCTQPVAVDLYCEEEQRMNQTSASSRVPHLILILADDVGWNGVSWHNDAVHMPHLAALAEQGVVLESLYASPACSPSRASLMTGRYSWRTAPSRCNMLPASAPDGVHLAYSMLPAHLAHAGYRSVHSGKCASLHVTPL